MANNQIALMARTPEFDTPFESQGKALQLRQMMNQGQVQDMDMQQRRQAIADDAAVRDVYRNVSDPQEQIKALYRVNPKAAMAAEKGRLDIGETRGKIDKATAETGAINFKLQKDKADYIIQKLTGVLAMPVIKDTSVADLAQDLIQQGSDAKQVLAQVANLPPESDQAGRRQEIEKLLRGNVAAKDQLSYVTPDANALLTARTSRENNAATVGASYANAAATQEIAKSTRDAASIQRDQATEMKLSDDYRAQSKDFKAVGDAYKQISATLDKATTSPAATLAAATKFMKLLDPGSVVRESELGMALAATGAFDRAANYVNTLRYGKVLTPSQAKDFKNITQQIYGAAQAGQKEVDASYRKQAETYKLRPEMVVQDLGQNTPVAQPGGGFKYLGKAE